MTRRLCEAPSCRVSAAAREVSPGFRFCRQCRQQLALDLAELPMLYDACERALEYGRGNMVGRVKGWRPSGIRLSGVALAARSAMIGVLASWCHLVMEQRGLGQRGLGQRGLEQRDPAAGDLVGPRHRDVEHMAAFLGVHLAWLTAHAAGGEFASEITDVAAAARRAACPGQRVRLELGPCAEPGCDGTVFATRTVGGSRDQQVSCDAGHIWQPHQWLMLGRWIEQTRSA